MKIILDIILKWSIPFILTALCGYMTSKIKETKKNSEEFKKEIKNDNEKLRESIGSLKDGMLSLLWSQIISKCETYQELGYLPSHVRTCLENLFEQYQSLGGNHGLEILVNKTFELPPNKKGVKE